MIGSRLAAGALVVLGLLIAWRVAATGVAVFLAAGDPQLALRFDSGQPEALLWRARERLIEADEAGAAALARKSLESRPLNAPAFRALGLAALEQGDTGRADVLMAQTAALTRRDPPASSWMFSKALRQADYRRAFRYADELLRRAPRYADRLFPQMIAAADQPAAADALAERLSHGPPWRELFLTTLTGQASEETLRGVLRRVQAGPRPLSDLEMNWVFRRYLDRHSRREVRALWVQLLPPRDRGRLAEIFDGGFETQPGLQPFAWQANRESSASAEFAPTEGASGKALHAEHFGTRNEHIIGQTLTLAPGRYLLSGRAKADAGGEPDALVWRLICDRGGDELVSIRPAQAGGWRAFSIPFVAPPGCDAQVLNLDARPMAGGATSVWFDDLRIERAGGAE